MKTKTLFKTIALVMVLGLMTTALTAQNIITIDNNVGSTTAQTTIQAAHDAASPGDIIYVQPSGTNYGNLTIDKPITIIGRSHNEPGKKCSISTVSLRASNVTVKGIDFTGSFTITQSGTTNPLPYTGIVLNECEFSSTLNIGQNFGTPTVDGIEIRGNVIRSTTYFYSDASNVLVSNNIMLPMSLFIYNPTSTVISNNIFRNTNTSYNVYNYGSGGPAIFHNNMYTCNTTSTGSTTCAFRLLDGTFNFSHNLTYNFNTGNTPFFQAAGGSFNESNTLVDTNPLFTNVDSTDSDSFAGSSSYNAGARPDDDLTLQAGSPALTGGGGGTEIGLFNNGFIYEQFGNAKGYPILDILSYDGAVPKNGNINVTIKAVAK